MFLGEPFAMNIKHKIADYVKTEVGVASIELAIILPVMLMLFMPMYDFYNYIVTQQRVVKASWSIADMIAMSADQKTADDESFISNGMVLNRCSLEEILQTSRFLMAPIDVTKQDNQFSVVVSSIQNFTGTGLKTHWTRRYNGLAITSGGSALTLPADFSTNMYNGENVIAIQVTVFIEPLFDLSALGITPLSPRFVTRKAFFPVRVGSLSTINNSCT